MPRKGRKAADDAAQPTAMAGGEAAGTATAESGPSVRPPRSRGASSRSAKVAGATPAGPMPAGARAVDPKQQGEAKQGEAKQGEAKPAHPASRKKAVAPRTRIVFLGGVGEIGRNMTLFEHEGKTLIIDTGLMFPTEEMLGVDLVLPDFSYVREHAASVVGMVLTH
ncbi:MAG TPA: hypothetical protein VKY26_04285, partial [Actinomycetota bacterium]|nr:hypothetical protein [Actinomycetota bacterium]